MTPQWRNWVGNQSGTPAALAAPTTEGEVRQVVRSAVARGEHIRPAGTGHSFSDVCLTDGTVLDMAGVRGIVAVDPGARTATVRAGTPIADLGDPLWENGLSLKNQGDIDTQQIAGAVSTATHGSGLLLQNMSASVVALRLVTAGGDVVTVDASEPDLLAAAQVSVGMLGVITELTLSVRDAFLIRERVEHWTLEQLAQDWSGTFAGSHHVALHYYPTATAHELFDFDGTGTDLTGMSRVTFGDVVEADPTARDDADGTQSIGSRTGRPYRIYPQYCAPNFHELEYMVGFDDGFAAFTDVLDVFARFPERAIYPIEVRVTEADTAFLSPNYERRSVVISVSGEPGTDYLPFLTAVHEVLLPYGARPHWGKLHMFPRGQLERVLPRHRDFVEIRRRLDPGGTFLNPTLAGLFA